MTSFDTTYAPGTAVSEYQADQKDKSDSAAKKAATPLMATYRLADEPADWNTLLHIEKPHLYSTKGLTLGLEKLRDSDVMVQTAAVTRQAERFAIELNSRA